MTSRTTVLVAIFVVASIAAAPTASADDPEFSAYPAQDTLVPGTESELTVQLVNAREGDDRVETARVVRATLGSDDAPVSIQSGTVVVEQIPGGGVAPISFQVAVDAGAAAGTYQLPLDLTYEHGSETTTETVDVTVEIERRAQFQVVETDADATVGDTGTISVTLENVGEETAHDARATFTSQSADVAFGEASSTSRFLGAVEPGETVTTEVSVGVAEDAKEHAYSLGVEVAFEDDGGMAKTSRSLSVGFVPAPEQRFTFGNVDSDLRVGEERTLTLTVENRGPKTAHDAVVRYVGEGPNVHHEETEYAVGDLEPGESAEVTFEIEVSDGAGAGPRQLTYVVEYDNDDGNTRQSDPLRAQVDVAEKRQLFDVTPNDARVGSGSSTAIEFEVTNRGEESVRDVNAKLFVNDPLSSSDDEAYVSELAPGESTTITFQVAASDSALQKSYPVSVDFQYDTPDGDTELSDTYRVPVEVTRPEDSDVPIRLFVAGIVAVGVVAVLGWTWWRR